MRERSFTSTKFIHNINLWEYFFWRKRTTIFKENSCPFSSIFIYIASITTLWKYFFYQQWPLSFSDTDSNKTHLSHSMSCYRLVPNPPYTIDCFLDNTNYIVQTWDSKFDLALLCFFFFPDPGASTDITKIYRAHTLGKWKVCQFSLRLNALNMSGQIVSAWKFSFSTCITL